MISSQIKAAGDIAAASRHEEARPSCFPRMPENRRGGGRMSANTSPTSNPRNYALSLVEVGVVSADHLLLCCLKAMSIDEVRWTLDANELSPRFMDGEDEEVAS